ncbi:MAG: efflux RND transporter periplasmic adaptor subunit [Terricaulis sp.]
MARRHFFLTGAVLAVTLMLVLGAFRLLLPNGTVQSAQGAGGRATQVTSVAAANRPFIDRIEALGVAKGQQSVNLSANSTELITAVHFHDGEMVRTGQVLVELKSTEERADVTNARAAVDVAQSNYNRYSTLAQAGFLAPAALDQYRAALRQAQAGLAAAQSRQQDRVIRAPFSGRLGMTDIAAGTLISPGATIVTVDDTTTIRVDFDVPDRFLPALQAGATIVAQPDPYPGQNIQGRISLVDSRIDPTTHAIRARAEFANPGGRLVPGMLMHIAIENGQRDAVAVPESAVQTEGDQTFVYVIAKQDGKDIARQTQVEVGANENGFIEIRSGISAGTNVVADGLSRVEPNAAVRVAGQGRGESQGGGGQRRNGAHREAKSMPADGLRATQP